MDLKKGDSVVMINCGEAEHYAGKVWTCRGDSFKDVNQQEVVFLEGFSGYFHCRFLVKPYKDADNDLYYLQDSRDFNGNYMMFWGLDDKGYTSDIRQAQTYTLEDAKKRACRETDIPRKVSDMQSLLRHCVDHQDLRKIKRENV